MAANFAANFSGSNYLSVANYTGNPTAFSVSCWVKLAATQLSRIFFSNYNNSSGLGWAPGISDSTNNKVKFYYGSGTLFQTGTLTNGTWAFLTFTHDGTTAKIYLNGATTPDATAIAAISYSGTAANNYIGCLQGVNQMLNGALAAVGYWSKALTGAEHATLYNSGLGLMFADLTGSLLTSLGSYHDFSAPLDLGLDLTANAHNFTNTASVAQVAGPSPLTAVDRQRRPRPVRFKLQALWRRTLLSGYVLAERGGLAVDLMQAHPGTLGGGATRTIGRFGSQVQVVDNGATGSYVDLGTMPSLLGIAEFTICILAALDTATDAPAAVGVRNLWTASRSGTSIDQSSIYYNAASGSLQFRPRYGNYTPLTALAPPLNQLTLITGRITATGAQSLWLDAVKVGEQTLASWLYAGDITPTLQLGASAINGENTNWSGPIVAAYLWGRALSDAEVVALASDPFAPVRVLESNVGWMTTLINVTTKARVSQVGVLSVMQGTPKDRVSQVGVLSVVQGTPKDRVSQVGILVVHTISSFAVEPIISYIKRRRRKIDNL